MNNKVTMNNTALSVKVTVDYVLIKLREKYLDEFVLKPHRLLKIYNLIGQRIVT